jgi:hypothetical protein
VAYSHFDGNIKSTAHWSFQDLSVAIRWYATVRDPPSSDAFEDALVTQAADLKSPFSGQKVNSVAANDEEQPAWRREGLSNDVCIRSETPEQLISQSVTEDQLLWVLLY